MDDWINDYFADTPSDLFSGYVSAFSGLDEYDTGGNNDGYQFLGDMLGTNDDVSIDWGYDVTPSDMSFDASLGESGGLGSGILSWMNGLSAADKNLLAQTLVGGISGYQKSKSEKKALEQRNRELELSAQERQRDRDATAAQSEEAWKRQMSLRQVPTGLSQPLSIMDFGLSLKRN